MHITRLLTAVTLALLAHGAPAQAAGSPDATLSPYFVVTGAEAGVDALRRRSMSDSLA
jgi:hypothetical protein